MSKVVTDNKHYIDIAEAIRNKGVSGSFKPEQMAAAIGQIEGGGGIAPTTITFASECNDFAAVGAIVKSFLPSTFGRIVLLADWAASQTYDFTAAVIYGQTETLPIGTWVRGTGGNNCSGNWTAAYSARVPAGATYSMYVLR